MFQSRAKLKALSLGALALMLTAVWAYVAQAEETGGKWTYETAGGVLKAFEGALAEPGFNGEIEAGTTVLLSTKALGSSFKYECKSLTFEGKLKGTEGGGSAALELKECEAFLNGVLSKSCSPTGGIIKTNKIKAAMLLHKLAGGTIDKVLIDSPAEGSGGFAFVESTEACNVGAKVLIGGRVAFQDAAPTTHNVKHLIKEFAPLTHLWIISDTAEHAATLTGSIELFLTEAHAGYKWAGLWN
jgi:hypothetical protein